MPHYFIIRRFIGYELCLEFILDIECVVDTECAVGSEFTLDTEYTVDVECAVDMECAMGVENTVYIYSVFRKSSEQNIYVHSCVSIGNTNLLQIEGIQIIQIDSMVKLQILHIN